MGSDVKMSESDYIGKDATDCSLSGVIPLLVMGAFGCAVSPPARTHFLSQPGRPLLTKGAHIDAKVSADTVSSWVIL